MGFFDRLNVPATPDVAPQPQLLPGRDGASPLFLHQAKSVGFLASRERALDFSDPGTGKTRVEIEDFAARRRAGGKCALIVATKSLLESAWENDFQAFAPDMKCAIAYAENRVKAFAQHADVYITNHDAASWLAKQPAAFFAKFDTLIIDELTAFKHHTSMRSKAMAKIRKFFPFRRGLTGTPNTNGITDVWHQAFLIDDGKRLGTSFYGFRASVCTPKQVGPQANMVQWEDRPGADVVVTALLKDITIRHKFEDVVEIPARSFRTLDVKLSAKHMALYKKFEQDAILQLADQKITALNGAVVRGKLLQIASGAVYDETGSWALVDTARYETVIDLVDERAHSIVFYLWNHQRDNLVERAKARKWPYAVLDGKQDVAQLVRDYQAGKYKVLFAHPKSAGHGLTLTRATSTIWASPTDNLEFWEQANRRIYRIGQTDKTETIVVLARGTVEVKVYQACMDKNVKMADLLESLQEAA